jgi:predicted Zn-dependent peptidase
MPARSGTTLARAGALGGILAVLARIREAGGAPTADELEQAKGGLVLSRWQRSLDGARPAAATLAVETVRHGSLDRLYRWPDAVRAVTGEQVRAAAERYIRPDLLATVLIGQIEAVRTSRHPRWPATLPELAPPAAPPR